jgi:hypothetical protein
MVHHRETHNLRMRGKGATLSTSSLRDKVKELKEVSPHQCPFFAVFN